MCLLIAMHASQIGRNRSDGLKLRSSNLDKRQIQFSKWASLFGAHLFESLGGLPVLACGWDYFRQAASGGIATPSKQFSKNLNDLLPPFVN